VDAGSQAQSAGVKSNYLICSVANNTVTLANYKKLFKRLCDGAPISVTFKDQPPKESWERRVRAVMRKTIPPPSKQRKHKTPQQSGPIAFIKRETITSDDFDGTETQDSRRTVAQDGVMGKISDSVAARRYTFGFRLLSKMGWDGNSGLGASQSGIEAPVLVRNRGVRVGLGVAGANQKHVNHAMSNRKRTGKRKGGRRKGGSHKKQTGIMHPKKKRKRKDWRRALALPTTQWRGARRSGRGGLGSGRGMKAWPRGRAVRGLRGHGRGFRGRSRGSQMKFRPT